MALLGIQRLSGGKNRRPEMPKQDREIDLKIFLRAAKLASVTGNVNSMTDGPSL